MSHVRMRHAGGIRTGAASKVKPFRSAQQPIRTTGTLRDAERAWVYVGVSRRGAVKVGMSADPDKRCAGLSIRLHYAQEVAPEAAREVETEALRRLGNRKYDGEWTVELPDDAVAAVMAAYQAVGAYRRVDPDLTDDEARARRISVASAAILPYGGKAVGFPSGKSDGGCVPDRRLLLWHAAIVEPGANLLAPQSLIEAGFQVIDPKVREAVTLPNGARTTITRPMWPGYVLMGRAPEQDWAPVYSARGLGGVLTRAGNQYGPAAVPDRLIDWLLATMGPSGVVEEISAPARLPEIAEDVALRVTRGPFCGSTGTCLWSSMERVTMLMDHLGGKLRVSIRRDHVMADGA
jgi:transcription antitermination factor NusG